MLILDKMSMPGWEFKTDHIEHIFWLLDQCVCDSCKMTEKQYEQWASTVDAEFDDLPRDDFCPDTYDQWSILEKVEWLMSTACGCEFDFYDEADGSGLSFAEIKS